MFEPSEGVSLCPPIRYNSTLKIKIDGVVVVHMNYIVKTPPKDVDKVRDILQEEGWLLLDQTEYVQRYGWGGLKMVKICVNEELVFPVGGYKIRTPTLVFSSADGSVPILTEVDP